MRLNSRAGSGSLAELSGVPSLRPVPRPFPRLPRPCARRAIPDPSAVTDREVISFVLDACFGRQGCALNPHATKRTQCMVVRAVNDANE